MDITTLAILNAQINGITGINMETALDAVTSRTDDSTISFCGNNCSTTCSYCTNALASVQAFYTNEDLPTNQVTEENQTFHDIVEAAMLEQMTWENQVQNARALDEIEEVARSGMWADQNFDGPDNHSLPDHCPCGCEDDDAASFDSYDDRQDYYEGYGETGLDWNEGGYYD